MRAFLSHSSRDKGLVEEIARALGAANVELDSLTFDQGLLNVSAIQQALKRSSLFVLFLSQSAISSNIVRYEALLAQELYAKGLIDKFLVICLDDSSFSSAEENWKTFNFVRKAVSVGSIVRLIQNSLVIAQLKQTSASHPFVGRSKELHDAKEKLIDPLASDTRAIFVSGNAGIGRRTFSRKLYRDVYPDVNNIFPEIHIEPLDGYEEIFRKIYQVISPITTLSAFRTRIAAFAIENDNGKAAQIAQMMQTLLEAREAIVIHDHGGLLNDRGGMQEPLRTVLTKIQNHSRPCVLFIADRMIPLSRRADLNGIIYCSLPSLARDEVRQLAALLLKQANISYSNTDLERIVELSDGHPFNVIFIVQAVKQYTLSVFLSDPSALVQWKRRRASEFLQKIDLSAPQKIALSALRDFNSLDFDTLALILAAEPQAVGQTLASLMEMHIIEAQGDTYLISPPLKVATDRDSRLVLPRDAHRKLLATVSEALTAQSEGGSVSLSLVNAGILAELQKDGEVSDLFAALLLPSHFVWLARRRYNQAQYQECIRFALIALESIGRLSPAGKIEACRWLCLASARRGQQDSFQKGITILKSEARDAWARSNLNFLLGFNARLQGHLPEAEEYQRESYKDSPGNHSAARELAFICMIRGDIESAESFAREAFEHAQDNPFVLDILLSVSIKVGRGRETAQEISFLFEKLKEVGEEEGHSFYTTRRAEYEMKSGRLAEASKLVDEAARKTPGIFNVRALRAQIYLEHGNKAVAWDEIKLLQSMVYKDSSGDRRTNLRPLLELEASYYTATGKYNEAKEIYKTKGVFTDSESKKAIKAIEYEQAFKSR